MQYKKMNIKSKMKNKIYLLSNQKYKDVENLEVFKIKYINANIDLSKYDALLFTSKNAIYSIDNFNKNWKKIPSYSIATKTSNIVEQLGGINQFDSKSSNGDEFASKLIPLLKNKKALYLRAKKVVSNLVEILKSANIDIEENIVYETICNDNLNTKLEKNSIIIFTSPSAIKCFFNQYDWDESFKAVVIGKTTANHLPQNIDYKISTEVNIQECINLAKQLYI